MKLTFTLTLTKSTITDIWKTILAEESNESVHEYFRDHILKAHFHSWDLQQDGVSGMYTITATPSHLDAAPLFNCFNAFCAHLARLGTNVDGYAPCEATGTMKTINLTCQQCDTARELFEWLKHNLTEELQEQTGEEYQATESQIQLLTHILSNVESNKEGE